MGSIEQNQKQNVQELSYGDHVCFLFSDMEDYKYIALNFIIDGLSKDEKVLCVVDEYPIHVLIEDLKNNDIDVEHLIETAQLIITSNEEVYSGNSSFNPVKTVEYWKQQLEEIKKERFSGFRAMGELLFAVDGKQESFDKLMEYELLCSKEIVPFYDKHTYLCIFNKSKFPPSVLEDMIEKHNVVINDRDLIKPNPYYLNVAAQLKKYEEKMSLRKRFFLDTKKYDEGIYSNHQSQSRDIEILKHVLGATGEGVWECNLQTLKIDFSDTFYQITGYLKQELIHEYHYLIKLIHPEDLYRFIHIIEKCCTNQIGYFDIEIRVKKKNGEWTWISLKGVPIERDVTNGKVLKMVGIFNNITDIKNIERELDEKIYFEKLRTDFFTNLSHEFRTPLNVILGSLQLQGLYINNKDMPNENIEKYKRCMKSMKQNCYRLLRLVNNLIDITKIETGFYSIDLQNYDIVSLIRDIVASVEDYVRKQKMIIRFNTNIDHVITACDPEKIERVMLNLLSNAIKFTQSGGEICVDVRKSNDEIVIFVKDTGVGIPQDKLEDIFNRFSQVDKSLTKNHEGSGIGLSLVKSIVEMHQGKVCVESKVKKGSKFAVHLPIRVIDEQLHCQPKLTAARITNVESMHVEFSDIYTNV